VHQARALLLDIHALLRRVAVRQSLLDSRHRPVDALRHVQPPQVHARRKALCFCLRLRADHERAHDGARLRLALGGLVPLAVGARDHVAAEGADEVRKGEA